MLEDLHVHVAVPILGFLLHLLTVLFFLDLLFLTHFLRELKVLLNNGYCINIFFVSIYFVYSTYIVITQCMKNNVMIKYETLNSMC